MIKLISKYKPLLNNTRYKIISGGRGSGKSYSVATYLLMLSFEKDRTIVYLRYIMKDIEISIYPEFINKIEELNLEHIFNITRNRIENKISGSVIIFKGIKTGSSNQTANLKGITNIDTLVVDEAEEIPSFDIFDKADYSIRSDNKSNNVILIFNPTTKASWIYEEFFLNKGLTDVYNGVIDDITYIHTTYKDIEDKLNTSFLQKIERDRINNPKKYEHIVMGKFLDVAEGIVFNNWRIGEFDESLPFLYGLDFGFSVDPTTLVKVAIDKTNMKIYVDEVFYAYPYQGKGLSTPEIIDKCKTLGDSLIVADNSEGRLINDAVMAGVNMIQCNKGANSVVEGIKQMLDYEIIITKDSINLLKEFSNYIWSDRRGNIPVDMYNHGIDAIRYAVKYKLSNSEFKPRVYRINR